MMTSPHAFRLPAAPWVRMVLTLLVALAGPVSRAIAQGDDAAAAADVVMMSPYEVSTRTVEFKGWTKLRSPNFIVYTDAPLSEVRPIVKQMEMLHLVAQVTFGRRPLNKVPALVVLPTSRSDWRKIRSQGSVEWEVAVSSLDWFQPGSVVEYNWQDDGISVLWASLTRAEMIWLGLDPPLALTNGFAYYFETIRMSKDGLRVGRGNSRVQWLQNGEWFNWKELFEINSSSPIYTRDTTALQRFNGQAALFVHYLMTRDEPGRVEQLLQWAALLRAGREPTEERFIATFGMTWEECTKRLRRFLNGEKFNVKVYNFPPESLDFVVTELGVKAQEMRDLFVLVSIHNQRVADSEVSLDAMLAKGLASPVLRPLLVSACMEWKRTEAAMEHLRLLIAEDNVSSEVFDLGVHLEFEKRVEKPGLDARLDEAGVDEIRQWGRLALAREPLQACMHEAMCWTEALAPEVGPESLETIKRHLAALDGNGDTDQGLAAFAVAAWRAGQTERARRACQLLLESDYSKAPWREIATEVLARIDGPAPGAAEASLP